MAITTVANCKAFRGIETSNAEHDAELTRLIPGVQTFLERECGRVFDTATVTQFFDGDDWRDSLIVSRPPITSITSLYDDLTRVFDDPLEATSYAIQDAEAGIIVLLDGLTFNAGRRNIKAVFVGGYATIPVDLEQAAIEMVWAAREKGLHNLIGVRNRSIGDGNVQFINMDWGSPNLMPVIQKYSLRTGVA